MEVRPLRSEDIPRSQVLMVKTWTEQLKLSTGLDIEYPVRRSNWYASRLEVEPEGCICIFDGDEMLAAGFALKCGTSGWIGPIEVLPEGQGQGLGKVLLNALEDHLRGRGCQFIGLETIKDSPKNVAFYEKAGYRNDGETLYLEKVLMKDRFIFGSRPYAHKEKEIGRLGNAVSPGYDPSSEFFMAVKSGQGRSVGLKGVAALLLQDPILGSGKSYLRSILCDSEERMESAMKLIRWSENEMMKGGASSIFTLLRSDSLFLPRLLRVGYLPKGVDLRMVKGDFPQNHRASIISWSG
ncbi:MAG: GNAT family N-acetyltransferase [Methanomassiliicoccus sp.]|nr:MAG: GNAT family N-acetyltransferase [Methanomassiliicoccus sp.]